MNEATRFREKMMAIGRGGLANSIRKISHHPHEACAVFVITANDKYACADCIALDNLALGVDGLRMLTQGEELTHAGILKRGRPGEYEILVIDQAGVIHWESFGDLVWVGLRGGEFTIVDVDESLLFHMLELHRVLDDLPKE